MNRLKVTLIAVAALAGVIFVLKHWLPPMFSPAPVPEEEQSADVDMPVTVRVRGGMLEVASVKGRRHFGGASDATIFGQALPFCRERAGWNVSYKITYRVKLGERWTLRFHKGRLIARVPELEPALPVAIDTKTLTASGTENCWFMMDLGTRERVLRGISAELEKVANQAATREFARPAARETINEFLRTWAFNQKEYPNIAPDAPVQLMFPHSM